MHKAVLREKTALSGKYKAYPEYKDSGVEWLGEIPSHWEIIPVGRCYRRIKRTGFEKEELLSVYRDYGVIPKSGQVSKLFNLVYNA